MKLFYVSILIWSYSYSILAQDTNLIKKSKQHSLITSIGNSQLKEHNLHSKLFHGLDYAFTYRRTWEKIHLAHLNIGIANSHLKTNIENTFSSANISLRFEFNQFWNILSENRIKLFVGGGLALRYHLGYFWVWDESHIYWANLLGMSINKRIEVMLPQNQSIIAMIFFTPHMILSRPPLSRDYKYDDFSFNGIMRNLHHRPEYRCAKNSSLIQSTIEYSYSSKNKKSPQLTYSFEYHSLATSVSGRRIMIQHLIGLKWHLS